MILSCLRPAQGQEFNNNNNNNNNNNTEQVRNDIAEVIPSKTQPARSEKSRIGNAAAISFSPANGASGCAIYSAIHLHLLEDSEWIQSQLNENNGRYIFGGIELEGFEALPPLETPVRGLNVAGQPLRIAISGKDKTKPATRESDSVPIPISKPISPLSEQDNNDAGSRVDNILINDTQGQTNDRQESNDVLSGSEAPDTTPKNSQSPDVPLPK